MFTMDVKQQQNKKSTDVILTLLHSELKLHGVLVVLSAVRVKVYRSLLFFWGCTIFGVIMVLDFRLLCIKWRDILELTGSSQIADKLLIDVAVVMIWDRLISVYQFKLNADC